MKKPKSMWSDDSLRRDVMVKIDGISKRGVNLNLVAKQKDGIVHIKDMHIKCFLELVERKDLVPLTKEEVLEYLKNKEVKIQNNLTPEDVKCASGTCEI